MQEQLSSVVGGWFRVNKNTADEGVGGAEIAFEFRDDGVDAFHGQVVGQGNDSGYGRCGRGRSENGS